MKHETKIKLLSLGAVISSFICTLSLFFSISETVLERFLYVVIACIIEGGMYLSAGSQTTGSLFCLMEL